MEARKPLSEADFRCLEEAVDTVVLTPSKADAKQPMQRLEALARQLERGLNDYQREKLRDVIACAGQASGSPRDKDQ